MGSSNSSQGGYGQNDSIFTQLWFWMVVIGIILLIIAAIDYAVRREARWWTWALVGIGAALTFLGIILGAMYANKKPAYPQYGMPQQPQMRAGCAPGVLGTAPYMVQPGMSMVPQGAMAPMALTRSVPVQPTMAPGVAPPILATPGGPVEMQRTTISSGMAAPVRVG